MRVEDFWEWWKDERRDDCPRGGRLHFIREPDGGVLRFMLTERFAALPQDSERSVGSTSGDGLSAGEPPSPGGGAPERDVG